MGKRARYEVGGVSPFAIRLAGGLLVPLLVLGSIWLPLVAHYHVRPALITPSIIERARATPPEAAGQSIKLDRLLNHGWPRNADVVAAADALLEGELRLGGQPPARYHLPFSPSDLTISPSSLQLPVAGLVPVDLLLRAYELTGDRRFFTSASAALLEFARYERRARIPRGLLWNDHAVANRVFVLSDFWRTYRGHEEFRPDVAGIVLEAAARAGAFLADPRHFTATSNHGVMQNVALLRFAVTFPALPNAEAYRRLAVERLGEQMTFYVADDGVVLEHSAAYQVFGISLIRMAFRYLQLLGMPVPAEWQAKHRRAQEYAAQLRRPDGTLPVFGDTVWRSSRPALSAHPPKRPTSWHPLGGYAVWWTGETRQTALTFSYFPGHAHKHADDLSVLVWTGGITWWTNIGFWPYQSPQRSQAVSWNGSNGPHLRDEPSTSARTTGLRAFGSGAATEVVDAVRDGPGTYRARRQVVYLRPDTWLVLDVVSGAPQRVSLTRWSTGYGISITGNGGQGRYVLRTRGGPATLLTFFFGSAGVTSRVLPSSLGPFNPRGGPDAARVPAVEVVQPAEESWAAAVWVLDAAGALTRRPSADPQMTVWRGAEHWAASLPGGRRRLAIARTGDRLVVTGDGRASDTVVLTTADPSPVATIREATAHTAARYPTFRDRIRLRRLSTYALLAAWGGQELSLIALARRAGQVPRWARRATTALWILGGIMLAVLFRWA